jgi:phage FluMu gp28-like protein
MIPADTNIRQSLHAVKKIVTSTGNFRFDADREEKIGHADHFWAKALAVQARSKPTIEIACAGAGDEEGKRSERREGLMGSMGRIGRLFGRRAA